MTKLVANYCYGGFSLSEEANKLLGVDYYDDEGDLESRSNPALVSVVESLGDKANGHCAKLRVVTIPTEATDVLITEYDGYETVYYVLDGKIRVAF